jgi:hypothetical protein
MVIVIVCALVAIVGGWLLVIQPKRSEASKLAGQVKDQQTQLDSARAQVAAGEAARSAYARNYTELVRLGEAVPPDDNVPSLIYQLQHAANQAKVDFRDLSLNPGTAGAASAPAAAAAATTSTTPGKTSSRAAANPVTQTSIATLPPGASIGPAGFPVEPFTFRFQGSFFHLADFFSRLQRFVVASNKRVSVSGRLMTLNAITFAAGPKGFPQITASISATTYLVPAAQGLLSGATPAGPSASTPAATVSTSHSSGTPSTAVATAPLR